MFRIAEEERLAREAEEELREEQEMLRLQQEQRKHEEERLRLAIEENERKKAEEEEKNEQERIAVSRTSFKMCSSVWFFTSIQQYVFHEFSFFFSAKRRKGYGRKNWRNAKRRRKKN